VRGRSESSFANFGLWVVLCGLQMCLSLSVDVFFLIAVISLQIAVRYFYFAVNFFQVAVAFFFLAVDNI